MHHYLTSTANTLSNRKEMAHVWRVVIPQTGYRHPFVTHGILAIAALHKATLEPNHRKTYLDLAAYHETVGSEGFRHALQDPNEDNWMPLFSFACSVVVYMFTLPTQLEGQRLMDPITNLLELVYLLKGINTTLEPRMRDLGRTVFAPFKYGLWPAETNGFPEG